MWKFEEIEHHIFDAIGSATAAQVVADVIKLADFIELALIAFIKLLDEENISGIPKAQAYAQEFAISIRHSLSATISSHMIPQYYMIVDSISNTTSEKVDRGKLRKAASLMRKESLSQLSHLERRAPKTPKEMKLHGVVAYVLNREERTFGMNSNFIQLGGDSIKAISLARIAREKGILLSVTDILTKDQIVDLLVTNQEADEYERKQVRFPSVDVVDSSAFVEEELMLQIQSGHGNLIDVLLATNMQSTYLEGNICVPRRSWIYCYIDFAQISDEPRFIQSCQQLVTHCDIYRTTFFRFGGIFFSSCL